MMVFSYTFNEEEMKLLKLGLIDLQKTFNDENDIVGVSQIDSLLFDIE